MPIPTFHLSGHLTPLPLLLSLLPSPALFRSHLHPIQWPHFHYSPFQPSFKATISLLSQLHPKYPAFMVQTSCDCLITHSLATSTPNQHPLFFLAQLRLTRPAAPPSLPPYPAPHAYLTPKKTPSPHSASSATPLPYPASDSPHSTRRLPLHMHTPANLSRLTFHDPLQATRSSPSPQKQLICATFLATALMPTLSLRCLPPRSHRKGGIPIFMPRI